MAGLLDLLLRSGGGTEGESVDALSTAGGNPILQAFIRLQAQRAKDAITAPRDAYTGDLQVWDPETGHTTQEAADRAGGMAGIAMTGGVGGVAARAGETTLGSGPIRAYHGSPHDFDKFSLSKIGTGEGAQAYGHGLYFAENEGVARSYRDALSGKQKAFLDGAPYAGNTTQPQSAKDVAAMVLEASNGDRKLAASNLDTFLSYMPEQAKHADEVRALLSGSRLDYRANPGHMYEVGIDADPAKMLNYDAGLAGQARGVQEYGGHLLSKMQEQGLMRGQGLSDVTGADIPYMTKRLGMAPATISQDLSSLGVPGVKYLDAGSRFSADKSHNFVTFSDDIVKILRKYGVASVAALPPAVRATLGLTEDSVKNLGMGAMPENIQ